MGDRKGWAVMWRRRPGVRTPDLFLELRHLNYVGTGGLAAAHVFDSRTQAGDYAEAFLLSPGPNYFPAEVVPLTVREVRSFGH